MSLKLRDLIRQVRSCKTAAEERAVIAKESAMIRTAIKEEQEHYRHRNVAKLLFMHMLGYPTHFGQLECMKLIASPRFPEKRIGYLGMLLLLSEETDVLMLATNSLKTDMNSSNRFVSGLALCTIGNLATPDMSRDLAPEVDKHLKSNNPYLRKKACLAMSRCLMKCPDMVDDFVDRAVSLLNDRAHGVLITVLQLMTQVLLIENNEASSEDDKPARTAFLKLVPSLVKLLRNLLSTGFAPEYDVGGISDPFLQVQILTILRLLGTNDEKASEEMNDVLAQVATNTETSKNAGNAILYECVQTIMAIQSDDALRVLAINILGRFLLNRDNNIRYVALNTLARCVVVPDSTDPNSAAAALQRHRTTIVECLKDPDISIRQRALELIYHLVNDDNVESLTAELLNYLVLCPREHRSDICARVLRVVEKYCPDERWRLDTLITMLTIAGRECNRFVQNSTIVYITRSSEDLRAYATHKLLKAIRDDDGSQHGLLIVGVWCIGEFGDLILKPYSYTPRRSEEPGNSTDMGEPVSISFMGLEPSAVVETVEDITKRQICPESVHLSALTCFVKLSERFATVDNAPTDKLRTLIEKHKGSYSLELQLRSCEYISLLKAAKGEIDATAGNDDMFLDTSAVDNSKIISAAKEALSRMPVVDIDLLQRKNKVESEIGPVGNINGGTSKVSASKTPAANTTVETSLLDLDDIFGGGGSPPQQAKAPEPVKPLNGIKSVKKVEETVAAPSADVDLLADIFSAPPAAAPTPATPVFDMFNPQPTPPQPQPTPPQPQPTVNDLFGSSAPSMAANPTPPAVPVADLFSPTPTPTTTTVAPVEDSPVIVSAFSKDGLEIEFSCRKDDPLVKQKTELVANFINKSGSPIYGLNMQCAVPKYISMELQPPTSTTVPVSGGTGSKQVTQTIKVTNSMMGTKNLMLKLKVSFTLNGNKVDHMTTCNGFPAGKF